MVKPGSIESTQRCHFHVQMSDIVWLVSTSLAVMIVMAHVITWVWTWVWTWICSSSWIFKGAVVVSLLSCVYDLVVDRDGCCEGDNDNDKQLPKRRTTITWYDNGFGEPIAPLPLPHQPMHRKSAGAAMRHKSTRLSVRK